jgi:WD40 repeat protein/serine/threonine protein kinase
VIARFEAERQALALMDHPNIAKVLDAGTTASSPALPNGEPGNVALYGDPPLSPPLRMGGAEGAALHSDPPRSPPLRKGAPGGVAWNGDNAPVADHPAAYAAGSPAGRPYFVMELVRGIPITDYCDKSSLPPRERLRLFIQVCQAVQHAHQKGVIHRDLKPSNVLVTLHDGVPVPKVIDFGVAKAINQRLTEHTVYTRMAQMVGTPMYMSPEQAELSGLDVDTRSDVYSLGVLLYELLTGATPFDKETFSKASYDEMRRMIREDEPPRPSQRVSTLEAKARSTISGKRGIDERQLTRALAGELDWIVMKALEKDRQRRYESASAFAADIQRYLDDQPVEACPPSIAYRARKYARRNRTMLTIVATVLLGGGALSLVIHDANLTQYNNDLTRLNDDLRRATTRAQSLQSTAEEDERQTKDALYATDISRAAMSLAARDAQGLNVLLDRHIPIGDEADRRGFEWWYLRRQVDLAHRVLLDVGSPLYVLCRSPDRRILAAAGKDAVVHLFEPESGVMKQEIATKQVEVNGVAFSPDGRELATTGDDGTIRVWNLETGNERLRIAAHPEKVFPLLYTPDGARIISSGDNPAIRVFSADSGRQIQTLEGHEKTIQSLVLADNAKTLVSSSDDRTARIWDLEAGTETSRITAEGHVWPLVVAFDRDLLITGSGFYEVETWSLREGKKIGHVKHLDEVQSLALHPEGRLLAAGDHGGSIRIWRLDADGTISPDDVRVWQAHRGTPYSLLWSADGSRLVSAGKDGRVISWSLAAMESSGPRRFEIDPAAAFCLIPGTASLVASGNNDSSLVRWNWDTGTEEGRFSGPINNQDVRISPDGRLLAVVSEARVLRILPLGEVFQPSPHPEWLILEWNPGGSVGSAQFSPDSQSVALACQADGTDGQPEARRFWLHGPPSFGQREPVPVSGARAASFAPDGRNLALATGSGVTLWDFVRQLPVWERALPDTSLVEFSRDGRYLVTGGSNRLVIVSNAHDGSIRFRFAGHRSPITSLTISPDSSTLATASRDGVIKLWHIPTGQELFELRGSGYSCGRMQFTDDGRHLLALIDGGRGRSEVLVFDAPRE